MNRMTTDVATITPIQGEEARRIATTEYDRMTTLLESLEPQDWTRPTACEGWTVRDMVGHLVGSLTQYASLRESVRQQFRGKRIAKQRGISEIDGWTAGQVEEWAEAPTTELVDRFADLAPRAVAKRMSLPRLIGRMKIDDGLGNDLTLGDLMRVVATRDSWMHRDDICQATGRQTNLGEHDRRLIADVVTEWAARHGQPFRLELTGPAGGTYQHGDGGPELTLDAVQFCRILSGRGTGEGLLRQGVPF